MFGISFGGLLQYYLRYYIFGIIFGNILRCYLRYYLRYFIFGIIFGMYAEDNTEEGDRR